MCMCIMQDVLFSFPASVSSIAVHPISPYYVAFGLGDGSVQVLDRRMLGSKPHPLSSTLGPPTSPSTSICRKYSIGNQVRKITSVQFNQDGSQLLASYSEDFVYLFNSKLLGCGAGSGGAGSSGGGDEIAKPVYLSQCESYSPAVPRKRKNRVGVSGLTVDQSNVSSPHSSRRDDANAAASKDPPAVKKLRLRGDWSDTGPEACPETEQSSESQGRSLMNHMSHMFAQWIDLSLSSDEQEREREGAGGGRWRRRLNERRRRRRQEQDAERSAEGGQEGAVESLNSSSSSDNSFSLFEDGEQHLLESSGNSHTLSNASGSSVGLSVKEEEGSAGDGAGRGGGVCAESLNLAPPQSSGESTKNESTAESGFHSDNPYPSRTQREGEENTEAGTSRDPGLASYERTSVLEQPATNSEESSHPPNSSEASAAVSVETRALNRSMKEVPSINIIEGETDSDDVREASCDRSTADQACDHSLKLGKEPASDVGNVGRDAIRPFMVYKGHRNARTMVGSMVGFLLRVILGGELY